MRRTLFTMIFVLTAVVTLHLMNTNAESSDKSKAVVANLEKQYFEALENQDQKLMGSLLDDDFKISSMSSNWSMNKEDFLKTLPDQVITSQEISATKVEIKGNRAYSQVDISMTKTFEGKDHSGDYKVYSIWVKKNGSWKLDSRKIKFLNPSE